MNGASLLPADFVARDQALTRQFDAALAEAAAKAGGHLQCQRGCTPCCIGVFDITALDAMRLRQGLGACRRNG
ncbi:MAG: hypothetical protein V1750_01920, partial [Acidobacteriota bacterium]